MSAKGYAGEISASVVNPNKKEEGEKENWTIVVDGLLSITNGMESDSIKEGDGCSDVNLSNNDVGKLTQRIFLLAVQ